MDTTWREKQERRARALEVALAEDGVDGVALSYVDNAGVARVKAVPVAGLPHAAGRGVGISPVFDVFCVDDSITSGRIAGGLGGDLRLYPDLDRLVCLAAQPGWAWRLRAWTNFLDRNCDPRSLWSTQPATSALSARRRATAFSSAATASRDFIRESIEEPTIRLE